MELGTFQDFLTEARFSRGNIEKVITNITRIVSRRLKTKVYRHGGPTGTVHVPNGNGYQFYYKYAGRTRAFRLNYIGGAINSVTLWKSYKLGSKGDYTITFDGLNIVQVVDKLVDLLKSPKTGEFGMFAEDLLYSSESEFLSEDIEDLMEAKRVSPAEFLQLAKQHMAPDEDPEKVSWDRIKELAILSDVNIPGAIRDNQVRKGKKGKGGPKPLWSLIVTDGDPTKSSGRNEVKQYYVKVTAQDPVTKKFVSIKDDKKALEMTKTIQGQLNNPSPQVIKQEEKHPDSLFRIMTSLTKLVVQGNRAGLLIYGGPGTGKTFNVIKTVKDSGATKNKDWFHIKGKITTASLYQTLFMHKDNKLLIFDDADSVWGDTEAANMLKAALDSYDERYISWITNRTVNVGLMDDEQREEFVRDTWEKMQIDPTDSKIKLPSEFKFNSRIIFISNFPVEKFDTAVLSRTAKIDMTLTKEQMFIRMESILPFLGEDPKKSKVPLEEKKKVLDFLRQTNDSGEIDQVTMRTYEAALDLYRSGLDNWTELLAYV